MTNVRMTDIEMMANPDAWPAWPFLPLRRVVDGRNPENGCLLDGHGSKVFHSNMFSGIKPGDKVTVHPSYQAILDEGWTVD